jgi:hypothetical protein
MPDDFDTEEHRGPQSYTERVISRNVYATFLKNSVNLCALCGSLCQKKQEKTLSLSHLAGAADEKADADGDQAQDNAGRHVAQSQPVRAVAEFVIGFIHE